MSLYPRPVVYKDFLNRPAPPNYVAGLGRGATGFTTRADIGPGRDLDDSGADAATDDPARFQDPENETGLFSSLPYTADDEEADRIYDSIDKKMEERRKSHKQENKNTNEKQSIQEQFADLKRGLAEVSVDEWASIPEVGDLTRRKGKKQKVEDRFTPLPDSVLASGRDSLSLSNVANEGTETPSTDGLMTDFREFNAVKNKALSLKLDQVTDSKSGQTTVDPKGYLTDLGSLNIKSDAEISDIKKARTLLKSVISTNPKHAPGWIAAARLEEVANRIAVARDIIAKGCEECPKNEDVWLESARLNTDENAKIILANAVRQIPHSVKIWLRAMQLEQDLKSQKRVLRRALEFIPNSVKIWKALISLEEDQEDAKILLSRAVECVPLSVDLWLALARLETYENAKKVLNKARQALTSSHEIWITAAKLEETQGNEKMVDTIIDRSVKILVQKGSTLSRDQWITEAENCDKEQYPLTCQAIIKATIGMGLDEEDWKHTWMEDAETCIKNSSITTARAIYAHAIKVFPQKKGVWRRAAMLEKTYGTPQAFESLLQNAVKYCPKAEVLWLMAAKEKWLSGDTPGARSILEAAFAANPDSEEIWLAAIKLESETGEYERARILLRSARERASTEKVWMKSAVLERQLGNHNEALNLLKQAIEKYPNFAKLWMMKGQVESEELNDISTARETYSNAVKKCPKSSTLWILASRLEEKAGLIIKARAILEKARLINTKSPELWCEAVRVENRGNNAPMARALIAKALQECPNSGLLWSEAILMENRPQRKARSADALKKCENDPLVILTVARLFWAERKLDKARNWLNKAVKSNPDLGDVWGWLLKFEIQHGDEKSVQDVISRCIAAEPNHGEIWQRIRKDLKNLRKSTEEILKLVAVEYQNIL